MPLFNEVEARYFFNPVVAAPVLPAASFRAWAKVLPAGQIATGTPAFEELRAQSKREVERLLILAASHYRRAHDFMTPISSSWSHVTMYYGSYYAANALLGALGAWKVGKFRIEPVHTAPGSQRFSKVRGSSTFTGSHEQFWEFYFDHAVSLVAAASSAERFGLNAISADVTWLAHHRNELNYDTYEALELASLHKTVFSAATFPTSLPGALSTQFKFLVSLLTIANRVAKSVGIESDAVSALSILPTRSERVREVVLATRPPGLATKVRAKVAVG